MKLTMNGIRGLLVCAVVFAIQSLVAAGNTCTWTGLGGDGSWQNPKNWENELAPVSGHNDRLVFTPTTGDLVVSNTVADFSVYQISCPANAGDYNVTINGERVQLTSTSSTIAEGAIYNDSPIVFNAEIYLNNTAYFATHRATFNGKITIDGTKSLYVRRREEPSGYLRNIVFNCDVYGPQANLFSSVGYNSSTSGAVLWNGKLTVSQLYVGEGNTSVPTSFTKSDNPVDMLLGSYNQYVNFSAKNVFTTNLVWDTAYNSLYSAVCYRLAADQVCNRLTTTSPHEKYSVIRPSTDSGIATLTLKATQSATCKVSFTKGMSIVYDPQGAFTQTFGGPTDSTMTGTIDVKGGTVALADTAQFSKVSGITIRKGGTFSVADSAAETPVSTSCTVTIFKGGKLVVPTGKTLTVGKLVYCGVPQADTTYSAEEWIEGGGNVTVSSGIPSGTVWWKDAADGSWSEAAKWSPSGVPAAGTAEIYIRADKEVDYTVTVDQSAYRFGRLYLGTDADAVATLSVTNDALFSNGTAFTVGKGGLFEQSAGDVVVSNEANAVEVKDGGIWRLSGGTQTIASTDYSLLRACEGGTVEVTDGTLTLLNTKRYSSPLVLYGGKISVSGTGVLDSYNDGNSGQWYMGNGEIEVKGDAQWTTCVLGGNVTAGKRLTCTFLDNAKLSVTVGMLIGYYKGQDFLLDIGSTNASSTIDTPLLGVNYSGRCEMKVRAGAVAPKMFSTFVGSYYSMQGFQYPAGGSDAMFPTGIVQVAGLLDFNKTATAIGSTISGLIVGSTDCTMGLRGGTWSKATTWPCGSVIIEPTGVVSNHAGYSWFGVGYGEGDLAIRGGRYVKDGMGFVAVGGGEGIGRLSITDGGSYTFTWGDTYVGSIDPIAYGFTWGENYPSAALTSTGRVDVINGLFDCSTKALRLGEHGSAFLNVGAAGEVKAKDMALSNSVETVVSFTANAAGALGSIRCTGALSIANGAKLKVDLSAAENIEKTTLIEATGGITGTFAAADIEIFGSDKAVARQQGNRITISEPKGLMLIVR